MAAINLEKSVSRQIAATNGHDLTPFRNYGTALVAGCNNCDMEFTIDRRGTKRCASNIDVPCPNVKAKAA